MISPETYQRLETEIKEFENKYPLIKELDSQCPYEISTYDLREQMTQQGTDTEKLLEYYLNKNLLSIHNYLTKKEGQKEVERTHKITGHLETLIMNHKIENPM